MASEKLNLTQLEHLQAKYTGTGSSDTTRDELLLTQHRDTYASILGHQNVLLYIATAENQSLARTRLMLLDTMVAPSLKAPKRVAPSRGEDNSQL